MTALLLTNNLLFSSQVSGAASRVGMTLRTIASVDNFSDAVNNASVVLIDLSLPGISIVDLMAEARSSTCPPTEIVAFGPHVHEARLQAARDAGCDMVMSQGAFTTAMNDILARAAEWSA
ncbi:MAG: hypothetical protein MPJ50_00450 [Pirellulales bacterium]|nr:hypothetical protein [Pirellulales bacterium]